MSVRRRRAISVGLLLVGYSALIGGSFGLAAKPLIGVLLVLGGMALLTCSAVELIQDKPDPGSDS
jgi:drug/metabolite transporter (DMT)-like permease